MAKSMARIENNIVINMEWYSDKMTETDTLKNIDDRPVEIGDTYFDGIFYRDGEKVKNTAEQLAEAETALAIILGNIS